MRYLLSFMLICLGSFSFANSTPDDIEDAVQELLFQKSITTHQAVDTLPETDDWTLYYPSTSWYSCRLEFGFERASLYFPLTYSSKRTEDSLIAYSLDEQWNFYFFAGFKPSLWGANPDIIFEAVLESAEEFPYSLVEHEISYKDNQVILDYVLYDCKEKETSYGRWVVTPFNVYYISCDIKDGKTGHWEEFRDGVYISPR